MRPRQLPPPQHSDDRLQPPECDAASKGGYDDKIGAPTFFAIRDLGAQDVRKPAFAHAGPAHYPFALQAGRRGHHQHKVAALDTAAFEEQRYVEDDEWRTPGAGPRDKPLFGSANHWMDDSLKPAKRRRVAEHKLAETLAIDPAHFVAYSGKHRLDRSDRFPTRSEQPMNDPIGVE
jgi:hypothetical protein